MMAKSIITDEINLVELRAADTTDLNANNLIVEKFSQAKECIPSILLIDEIDKIAGASDDFFMENNDNASKILLEELDSIKPNCGVLVVATCNDYNSLHKALRRSGRFDRAIQIKNPTYDERMKIADLYLDNVKLNKEINSEYIAKITPNFTGAEIETLINEASIEALSTNESLNKKSLNRALNRMRFKSVENEELSDDEAKIVSVHEAGHALLTVLTAPETLNTVSIIPQGNAKGFVMMGDSRVPRFMRGYKPPRAKQTFKNVIIAFGGRAAEKLVFKKYSEGYNSDLSNAYELIYDDLVSEGLYGTKYFEIVRGPVISDEATNKIKKLMVKYEKDATKMLKKHIKLLRIISDALFERKTLSQEEVLELCNGYI